MAKIFKTAFDEVVTNHISTTTKELNFDSFTECGTYQIYEDMGNGRSCTHQLIVDKSAEGACTTQTRICKGNTSYRCYDSKTEKWSEWVTQGGGAVVESVGKEYNTETDAGEILKGEIFNDYENNTAEGDLSHAENKKTKAVGVASHAEGYKTEANGQITHVEGALCIADGDYSHAEGYNTKTQGFGAHAEGSHTIAKGESGHAEGNGCKAAGANSHAEGYQTEAFSHSSHAEGKFSRATGAFGHAEGYQTQAGDYAHSEGNCTVASADGSHTEGCGTIADGEWQHVQGKWNVLDGESKYAHIVGGGWNNENRKNIHTLDWVGNGWYAGNIEASGIILRSSKEGSTKKFLLTVDDTGSLNIQAIESEVLTDE